MPVPPPGRAGSPPPAAGGTLRIPGPGEVDSLVGRWGARGGYDEGGLPVPLDDATPWHLTWLGSPIKSGHQLTNMSQEAYTGTKRRVQGEGCPGRNLQRLPLPHHRDSPFLRPPPTSNDYGSWLRACTQTPPAPGDVRSTSTQLWHRRHQNGDAGPLPERPSQPQGWAARAGGKGIKTLYRPPVPQLARRADRSPPAAPADAAAPPSPHARALGLRARRAGAPSPRSPIGQGKVGGCYDVADSPPRRRPAETQGGRRVLEYRTWKTGSTVVALRNGEGGRGVPQLDPRPAGGGAAAAASVRTASMLDMRKCYYHKTI